MIIQEQISIIVEEETVVVQIIATWTVKKGGKGRKGKQAQGCLQAKGNHIVYLVSF